MAENTTFASQRIIDALTAEFVKIYEGSGNHPVRFSHKSVDDAIAHIREQDATIAHHRSLLEVIGGSNG